MADRGMDLDHERLDAYHLALDFLVLASEIAVERVLRAVRGPSARWRISPVRPSLRFASRLCPLTLCAFCFGALPSPCSQKLELGCLNFLAGPYHPRPSKYSRFEKPVSIMAVILADC